MLLTYLLLCMDTAQLRIGWALGELAAANHDCPAETVGKNNNFI